MNLGDIGFHLPARRSGDIAERLNRKVEGVAPIRSAPIAKGMIYSPAHGDTAFTVPMFDGFMKRTVPRFEPLVKYLFFGLSQRRT